MRISDWSSDVCSSDLGALEAAVKQRDRQALQPLGQSLGADVRELGGEVERRERFNRDSGILRELEELIANPSHRQDKGGDAHAQGGDTCGGHTNGGAGGAQGRLAWKQDGEGKRRISTEK